MIKVLLVEDERIQAWALQRMLEGAGYAVVGCSDTGEDAVGKARETQPDVILMDVRLRGSMDGIAAAEAIQTLCGAPVVYLSALADAGTLRRMERTRPFRRLGKPFAHQELITAIESVLHSIADPAGCGPQRRPA